MIFLKLEKFSFLAKQKIFLVLRKFLNLILSKQIKKKNSYVSNSVIYYYYSISYFLFIIIIVSAIFYLLLLQYTKFFSFPPYLAKISLNLNFYFTILYIICFLISLLYYVIENGAALLAEVIVHTSPYSPYTSTSPADIPRIVVDENGKFLGKLKSNEGIFEFLKNYEDRSKNINVNENPPKSINVNQDSSQDAGVVAHSPKETTPVPTKWWQVFTKVQHVTEDTVRTGLDKALKKPYCTEGNPELLKAAFEGISKGTENPHFTGPFTPKEIGITDLNTHDTSVPVFQKIVANKQTGENQAYTCTNLQNAIDMNSSTFEHVNHTPRFNKVEAFSINTAIKITGWDETVCVKMEPSAEGLLTQQSVESSGNEYSPKHPSLFDPSN